MNVCIAGTYPVQSHGAAVVNADGVTSQNIVGYQQITIPTGYSFFTVTFENITNSATFNLSDIVCLTSGGEAWLRTGAGTKACAGAILLRKISTSGAYGQEYKYYGKNTADTVGPGWYVGDRESDGSNLVTGDAVTFNPGEGVIMYSTKTEAKLQISGGVKLTALNKTIPTGYSFGGNTTPVVLNLSAVDCLTSGGEAWLRTGAGTKACAGAILLRKISTSGAYGQEYKYYGKNTADTFGPGWYVGDRLSDGSNLVTGDAVTFNPGEGWIMYSTKTDAQIVIPSALQ